MLPTSLHADPRLPGYEFHVIAGTVLSATVLLSPRSGPPAGVNQTALRYHDLWVRREDGAEVRLFADADQLQVREDHRVTLIVAARSDGTQYVVRAWNHDAPHYSAVVKSAVTSVAFGFPGQASCFGLPITALLGAQLIGIVIGDSLGSAAGALTAILFFSGIIALWFRRGERDRQIRLAREAALLEHLAAITGALSLPAPEAAMPGGDLG